MKKDFIYATISAIALVGAVSLTSCSSNEDVADINPTFDGEAVKTQFTISLPFGNNAMTRQTSSVVQQAENITSFRGMDGIVLIPYSDATTRTSRLGGNITLNKMLVPSAGDVNNSIPEGSLLSGTGNNNAVLYKDVTIPVGTAGFLFYAHAKASTDENAFTDGSLTGPDFVSNQTIEAANISFTPTQIKSTLVTTKGESLAAYVTSIAAAAPASGDGAWWKCASSYYSSTAGYNEGLGELYKSFISMKAGASSYVFAAVQDLYTTILNNTDDISEAIKAAILNSTYVTNAPSASDPAPTTLAFADNINNYPGGDNNFMPDGTAALTWSISATDASKTGDDHPTAASAATAVTDNSSISYGGMNLVNMTNIVYPASLYYYVSSPIRVSSTSRQSNYIDSNSWETILNSYSNTNGAVSSSTRSVAITTPIDYAVGRLDVTVNALGSNPHYDRKGKAVVFPDGAEAANQCFPLTGVLIGGQKAVGYNFEPITSGSEYTIYDKTINTVANSVYDYISSTVSAGPTYTLALETAANTEVYVALEFVNNAKDFQGLDGVVKHGCKFYMIAKLDPKADVTNQVSGVSNTGKRVFKQDYKTMANFSIGEGAPDENGDGQPDTGSFGGFANAYVTIPDLRTPQLELGLSVNLEWRPGIEFSVTF